MFVVEVNHVVKSYVDKMTVCDLSFSLSRNEAFGLIGSNGAGKTTTLTSTSAIAAEQGGYGNFIIPAAFSLLLVLT